MLLRAAERFGTDPTAVVPGTVRGPAYRRLLVAYETLRQAEDARRDQLLIEAAGAAGAV